MNWAVHRYLSASVAAGGRAVTSGIKSTFNAVALVLQLADWFIATSQPSGPPAGDDVRDRLPSRYGHYAIERKLGEGGMGVVYAARDERLERTVALKMMRSLAHDETARQRFWREARAAASVNHPNICQIYEIGEDERRRCSSRWSCSRASRWPSACNGVR